jgi:hypothetical protein
MVETSRLTLELTKRVERLRYKHEGALNIKRCVKLKNLSAVCFRIKKTPKTWSPAVQSSRRGSACDRLEETGNQMRVCGLGLRLLHMDDQPDLQYYE